MNMHKLGKVCVLLVVGVVSASILLASEGGGEGGGSELGNLVWRIFNFAALVALLWWLLADKMKVYFSGRRNDIANLLDEIEKAKLESQQQFKLYEDKFRNIERDTQEIKNLLMGELEAEKARIMEEGKAASERIMEQARAAADQEVIKARKDLRDYVVDLAGNMAVDIVTKGMQAQDQTRIVEEYLDKVVRKS